MDREAIKVANKWTGGLALAVLGFVGIVLAVYFLPSPWDGVFWVIAILCSYWVMFYLQESSSNRSRRTL